VEEKIILVLIQIVEANGTLPPTHNTGKSDGVDTAIIIAASRWQGLLVLLDVVLLLSRHLLGRLLPQEMGKLAFKDSLYVKSL
jgi:hypothetical protein